MNRCAFPAALAASALILAGPACAASSDWQHVEGASIRVVAERDGGQGEPLRAVLQIDLEEGWKTYWADPGDAGVPPSITASDTGDVEGVEVLYPPPKRFDDGYSVWAGYDSSVALPVLLHRSAASGPIGLSVFLGVCETICIPVQAEFLLDPEGADAGDDALVAEAFDALPAGPSDDFRLSPVEREDDGLVVEAQLPAGNDFVDLFVAGDGVHSFAAPEPVPGSEDGDTRFRLSFVMQPKEPAAGTFFYTLIGEAGAVSGTIEVPAP